MVYYGRKGSVYHRLALLRGGTGNVIPAVDLPPISAALAD
jgi:hypothetical protein